MIPFTFKQLQVFVNTAHCKSLSKAAGKSYITQAAASMSLIQLEQILDKPLFERIGKRLHLNANGELLLPIATAILNQAEAMKAEAFSELNDLSGCLKIGASTTIANYTLPKLIASFKKKHPQVIVELIIDNSTTIANCMNKLELELGFVEGNVEKQQLICQSWMEDELVIVCSKNHPLNRIPTLSIKHLTQYRWLFREQGSGTRMMFERAMCGDEHFDVEMVINSSEAIINYLSNSECLSYLSKIIYHNSLRNNELTALDVKEFQAKRYFYLLQNPKKYQTKVSKAFLKFVTS